MSESRTPPTINEIESEAILRDQLEEARNTIRRLNRRVQSAEAGLAEKVNANAGRSFGRILANSAATMYSAQLEECRAEVASLRETAISPEEARAVLDYYDTGNDWKRTLPKAIAKLRRISGGAVGVKEEEQE